MNRVKMTQITLINVDKYIKNDRANRILILLCWLIANLHVSIREPNET